MCLSWLPMYCKQTKQLLTYAHGFVQVGLVEAKPIINPVIVINFCSTTIKCICLYFKTVENKSRIRKETPSAI